MRDNLTTVSRALRPALVPSLIALAGILASPAALAQAKYDTTLLPPYCKYTQLYRQNVPGGSDQAQIDRWGSVLGAGNFWHLHHYCFGLEHTNLALYSSRSKLERDSELAQSVTEFRYVLDRVAPDFALVPEILTKKGENLLRLGKSEGVGDLTRAIQLKPDHWPAYAALSDYYRTLGDFEAARTWAERGLSAAPGTKALQRRLAELDKTKTRHNASAN